MRRKVGQFLKGLVARRRSWGGGLRMGVMGMMLGVGMMGGCKKEEPTTAPAVPVVHAALPAPKPTEALPEGISCVNVQLNCHLTYQTAAQIHGPVAAGSCMSCHQADQGGHVYPLLRQGNATCTFCHAVSGTKAHQHKALDQMAAGGEKGGCLNCHDPHTSRAKYLLVADSVEALCAKCHNLPLKKHAHEPFAAGQCTVCHQAHQSDYASLLRNGDGPEHCFGCHTEKRVAMAQSTHVHKESQKSCLTCHGPHATDNAKQLKLPVNETCLNCHKEVREELAKAKQVHGALTVGNCASCHDPHASNQPAELKARTDKVCLTCHEKAVKTAEGRMITAMGPVLASTNLHGPVKTGSCSECHLPHAADQPNLLKKYFPETFYASFDVKSYALCFSCHDQQLVLKEKTTGLTNFRDGEKNLHFVHVNRADKGRVCTTCHEIHGSNLPKHMASSVPFEGSGWSMPIQYEELKDGGTCTPACHEERVYHRNKGAETEPAQRGGR